MLDRWAADVRAVAGFTVIREDQWRGHSQLADLLVKQVGQLLEAEGKLPRPSVMLEVRSTVTAPQLVELVGRQQSLQQALQSLTGGRYVEVVGGPGEGKSLLVQRLVAMTTEQWQQQPVPETGGRVAHALEVDLSLEGLRGDGLLDGNNLKYVVAAKVLAQVQETADKEQWGVLQGWLRRQAPSPVLIAFENAEQCIAAPVYGGTAFKPLGEAFQEVLEQLSRLEHVHLVVATRARTPGLQRPLPAGSVVVLEQLSDADGLRLVETRLGAGHQWPADGQDQAAAHQLVQLVQSNPLTLAVAAGLVMRGRRTWQEVLQGAQHGVHNISASRLDPGMRPHIAALTRWLTECLEGQERQLLANVSVFPGSFTAPAASAVTPTMDTAAVADTLHLLVDMSLLRQHTSAAISDLQPGLTEIRHSLHALVRGAAGATLDPIAKDKGLQSLARWMLLDSEGPRQLLLQCQPAGTSPDTARRLHLLREEVHNFAAVGARLEVAGRGTIAAAADLRELLGTAGKVGRVLTDCGHGHVAKLAQETAVGVAARIMGPEHLGTLHAKLCLANTLKATGDLGGARRLQEEVLEAHTRVLGLEHPDTLCTKGNLANTLRAMGDVGRARRLQEEVLEAHMRVLGPEHPETLYTKHSLAITLDVTGDLDVARRLKEEALGARIRVLGPEHPDTLRSMNGLAYTLWLLGELADARQLAEQAVAGHQQVSGPQHPNTMFAQETLGVLLRDMGEVAEGRRLQEEALAVLEPLRGSSNSIVLEAKHNLAVTLLACGEVAEARRMLEAVLEARTRVLGPEHPETLKTKSALEGLG